MNWRNIFIALATITGIATFISLIWVIGSYADNHDTKKVAFYFMVSLLILLMISASLAAGLTR